MINNSLSNEHGVIKSDINQSGSNKVRLQRNRTKLIKLTVIHIRRQNRLLVTVGSDAALQRGTQQSAGEPLEKRDISSRLFRQSGCKTYLSDVL